MMRQRIINLPLLCAAFVLVLLLSAVSPTLAVVNGEEDGNAHPYVALLIFRLSPTNWSSCTGTLISPQVIVTAKHCTNPNAQVEVWFDVDLHNYPNVPAGSTPVMGRSVSMPRGVAGNPSKNIDVGLVLLNTPVVMAEYARLAPVGFLDTLNRRQRNATYFTLVGYGVLDSNTNNANPGWGIRKQGAQQLMSTTEFIGVFNGSSGHAPIEGGTACPGDSGGPLFYQDTNMVVAVVSSGMNYTCNGGLGRDYRVDTAHVRAWINRYL